MGENRLKLLRHSLHSHPAVFLGVGLLSGLIANAHGWPSGLTVFVVGICLLLAAQ